MTKELGILIARLREQKGLSQRKLAKQIGYSPTYIAKIETGNQRGSHTILWKLARALKVKPDLVFTAAGIRLITVPTRRSLDAKALEFAELPHEVQELLLKIAPIIESYSDHKM